MCEFVVRPIGWLATKAPVMKLTPTFVAACIFACAIGCDSASDNVPLAELDPPQDVTAIEETYSSLLTITERDAEIIHFVLSQYDEPIPDRIYFLTTTPMVAWGEDGQWKDLPTEFTQPLQALKVTYRPASEAYLSEGHVLEKGTNAKAWMKWVSIKKWISDTEVEVEDGVWCCPLGGGASTATYKKMRNGKWVIKTRGPGWVS